jgi:predicted  nucleic acid-binding Zn ribbon protein
MERNMAEQNNNESVVETQDSTQAESGVIINAVQMQSLDINDRFTRVKTDTGWKITLAAAARVTISFTASMRKFETVLMANDIIERDGNDLILLRNQPTDAYRSQRSVSPLARSSGQTLASEPIEGKTV